MTIKDDLRFIVQGLAEKNRDINRELEARFDAKLDALEERLKSGINLADVYEGAHLFGKSYQRGKLVTHQGSLWLCMKDNDERPGDSGAWRLIVKRGKDG